VPQVVRSRLQQRMARRAIRYRSGLDVLRITLRREGVGGLYKGLLPNVLRVMPQVQFLQDLAAECSRARCSGRPGPPTAGCPLLAGAAGWCDWHTLAASLRLNGSRTWKHVFSAVLIIQSEGPRPVTSR
jgi:Mitochondrial carrier protein